MKRALFFSSVLVLITSLMALTRGQVTNPPEAAAASASTLGQATSSIVSNGDFSLATRDPAWPDDWQKGAGLSWETEGGKHFLRVTATEPGKMLMAYREVAIPTGVKKLEISIRYRTSGVVHGEQNFMDARAIFHFVDAGHKPLKGDPAVMDFAKGAGIDWTTATEVCAVPDGADKLVLMPSLFKVNAGTLDLAEIRVTPPTP